MKRIAMLIILPVLFCLFLTAIGLQEVCASPEKISPQKTRLFPLFPHASLDYFLFEHAAFAAGLLFQSSKAHEDATEYIFHHEGGNPWEAAVFLRKGRLHQFFLGGGREAQKEAFRNTENFLKIVLSLPSLMLTQKEVSFIIKGLFEYSEGENPYVYSPEKQEKIKQTFVRVRSIYLIAFLSKTRFEILIWPKNRWH